MAEHQTETRLTVIEVHHCQGRYGKWTELEAWWWHRGDAHARRYRLSVDGRPQIRIGDLIASHSESPSPAWWAWWSNHGDRRPGWLLLIGEVEQLPPLGP